MKLHWGRIIGHTLGFITRQAIAAALIVAFIGFYIERGWVK